MSYYDDLKITLNKKRINFFEGNEFNIIISIPNYEHFKELSYIRILYFLDLVGQFSKENFLNINIIITINDLFQSLNSIEDIENIKNKNKSEFYSLIKKLNLNFKYKIIFTSEIKEELFNFYQNNFKDTYNIENNYNNYFYINTSTSKFQQETSKTKFQKNNKRKNPRDFSIAIFDNSQKTENNLDNFIPTTTLNLAYLLSKNINTKNIFIYSQYSQKIQHNINILEKILSLKINNKIMFTPVDIKKNRRHITIDEINESNFNRLRLILLYLNPEKTVKLTKTNNDFFEKLIFNFKEIYYETSFIYKHTKPKYISYKEEKIINKLKEALYFSKYFATEELNFSKSVVILKNIIKDIYEYINNNEIHSKQVIYEIINFLKLTNSFFKLIPKEERLKFNKLVDNQQSLIEDYIKAERENKYSVTNKINSFFLKYNLKIKNTAYGYFLLELYEKTPLIQR